MYQSTVPYLVPKVGLEPTRCLQQRILSPSRLPFHHFGVSTESFIIIYDIEKKCKRFTIHFTYFFNIFLNKFLFPCDFFYFVVK